MQPVAAPGAVSGTAQPRILQVLDLSTAHLTEALGGDDCDILGIDGVHVQRLEYGFLLYVPSDLAGTLAEHADIPDVIVGIWRFAATHECSYVLIDRDADTVAGLPVFDW